MGANDLTHHIEGGNLGGRDNLFTIASKQTANFNGRLNSLSSIFPKWFIDCVGNGELDKVIKHAFTLQMNTLGFNSEQKSIVNEFVISNYGKFFIFNHDFEGLFPNSNTYGYTPATFPINPNSIEELIGYMLSSGTSYIGFYPNQFLNLQELVGTINHELNHFLLRILYCLRSTKTPKETAKSINSEVFSYITEVLAHMDGGQSLFHYGNLGDETLYRKSGKGKGFDTLYGHSAELASSLTFLNVQIYNILGDNYGFDPSLPINKQLFGKGLNTFNLYNRKLRDLLIKSIDDSDLFTRIVNLIISKQFTQFYNFVINSR